jgi:hypothetical protein
MNPLPPFEEAYPMGAAEAQAPARLMQPILFKTIIMLS